MFGHAKQVAGLDRAKPGKVIGEFCSVRLFFWKNHYFDSIDRHLVIAEVRTYPQVPDPNVTTKTVTTCLQWNSGEEVITWLGVQILSAAAC